MPYDGLMTRKIKEELSCLLLNCKVDKVHQPNKDEIIFHFRSSIGNYKLLLSANAMSARVHLTTHDFKNPQNPFNFCMVLRKHFLGARLISISQISNDRILKFVFENSNEIGDKEIKNIIIEMMGKHSNIIITNSSDTIIDSLKHIDFEISRVREVMPGRSYLLPPSQGKTDPFAISENEFTSLFSASDLPVHKFLITSFSGICTPFAKWIEKNTDNNLFPFWSSAINLSGTPMVFLKDNSPEDFYFCEISDLPFTSFDTFSEALDFFFNHTLTKNILDSQKHSLSSLVSDHILKLEKKLEIVEAKLSLSAEAETLRLSGELLSANLYRVPANSSEVTVDNYYTNTSMTIPLFPNLTPSENLQKIFKRYNKLKSTFVACSKQKSELLSELSYLESISFEINSLTNIQDAEEIKSELISSGYLKGASPKNNVLHKSEPIKICFEGFNIFVGKNNIQNDYLTFKLSSKNDIWFHVKNAPGSHTILRSNGQEVPENVIEKAASLSAYHSKLKASPKVEVDYTNVKNVKKIPGAKPGMVTYSNFKSIYIIPSSEEEV